MARLTNEARDAVVTKAIASRFKARDAALEAQRTVVADALYKHAYGKDEAQVRALPPGWVSRASEIFISCKGFCGRYEHKPLGPSSCLKLSAERPWPSAVVGSPFTIDDKHPLQKKVLPLVTEHCAIADAKAELTAKLRALVYSVQTYEKLLEMWPEGAEFVPTPPSTGRALVPLQLIPEINQMMGIKGRKRIEVAS